jgi:hypothetical protein
VQAPIAGPRRLRPLDSSITLKDDGQSVRVAAAAILVGATLGLAPGAAAATIVSPSEGHTSRVDEGVQFEWQWTDDEWASRVHICSDASMTSCWVYGPFGQQGNVIYGEWASNRGAEKSPWLPPAIPPGTYLWQLSHLLRSYPSGMWHMDSNPPRRITFTPRPPPPPRVGIERAKKIAGALLVRRFGRRYWQPPHWRRWCNPNLGGVEVTCHYRWEGRDDWIYRAEIHMRRVGNVVRWRMDPWRLRHDRYNSFNELRDARGTWRLSVRLLRATTRSLPPGR